MMKMMRSVALLTLLGGGLAEAADWQLVWSDEFDQPGLPDPAKWTYEEGFVRNNEAQFYTRDRMENARVEGGNLVIEAHRERLFDPASRADGPEGSQPAKAFVDHYTSASLNTRGITNWTYGRFEVRAKVPVGRGIFPSFWMGGHRPGVRYPANGLITIMSFAGYNPNTLYSCLETAKYNPAKQTQKSGSVKVPSPDKNFHVYAIEWTPEKIDFLVDRKKYYSFANEHTGADAWPFDWPHSLTLNTAVAGTWAGQKGIDPAIFPARFLIDYVRVYQDKAVKLNGGME